MHKIVVLFTIIVLTKNLTAMEDVSLGKLANIKPALVGEVIKTNSFNIIGRFLQKYYRVPLISRRQAYFETTETFYEGTEYLMQENTDTKSALACFQKISYNENVPSYLAHKKNNAAVFATKTIYNPLASFACAKIALTQNSISEAYDYLKPIVCTARYEPYPISHLIAYLFMDIAYTYKHAEAQNYLTKNFHIIQIAAEEMRRHEKLPISHKALLITRKVEILAFNTVLAVSTVNMSQELSDEEITELLNSPEILSTIPLTTKQKALALYKTLHKKNKIKYSGPIQYSMRPI
jgi:hypothetical protein